MTIFTTTHGKVLATVYEGLPINNISSLRLFYIVRQFLQ